MMRHCCEVIGCIVVMMRQCCDVSGVTVVMRLHSCDVSGVTCYEMALLWYQWCYSDYEVAQL